VYGNVRYDTMIREPVSGRARVDVQLLQFTNAVDFVLPNVRIVSKECLRITKFPAIVAYGVSTSTGKVLRCVFSRLTYCTIFGF
jgi:hypothetical protein